MILTIDKECLSVDGFKYNFPFTPRLVDCSSTLLMKVDSSKAANQLEDLLLV